MVSIYQGLHILEEHFTIALKEYGVVVESLEEIVTPLIDGVYEYE